MSTTQTATPTIGQPWPEQGGIFIGTRLIEGQPHHIIIPGGIEHDTEEVEFSETENAVADKGEINGFNDWHVPDQEDMMLAFINAREHFNQSGWASIYWTRSTCDDYGWAVDFEFGYVFLNFRYYNYRVRPVRSIIASSI